MILAFIIPRLYRITEPISDIHNVRQTQTAMITHNLVEDNFNLLYTRIDWFGDTKTYVIQEFPFYQLIVGAGWKLFGEHDTIGRVISLLFSLFLIVFLYKLVKLLLNSRIAYLSVFAFALCPLCIYLSRVFMINMTSLSLSIIALYYWIRWLQTKKWILLLFCSSSLILATLINLPIVVPLIFVFPYLAIKSWNNKLSFYISLILFISALAFSVLVWNLHLARVNEAFYPDWNAEVLRKHFFGVGISRFDLFNWLKICLRLFVFVTGIHGIILGVFGVKVTVSKKFPITGLLLAWALGSVLYYYLFFNAILYHNYYALPVTPLICIFIGIGADYIIQRIQKSHSVVLKKIVVPLFIITLICWIVIPIIHSTSEDKIAYEAGLSLQNATKKNDLVLTAVFHSRVATPKIYPTILYFAKRKGWNIATIWNPQDFDTLMISKYKKKGAKYLVVTYGSVDQSTVAQLFPFFKYFSHKTNFNIKDKITNLKDNYQLIELKSNYAIFGL